MLNLEEVKIVATIEIANLFGVEYVKNHLADAAESYPSEENDDIEYEYFLGFEGDEKTGLWSVFARVSVNRETREVTFLDYKTPEGVRMENPVKPISFA